MIKDDVTRDIKDAMRAKDKMKLSVLRMLSSSIKNAEINKRRDLTEEEELEAAMREVKKRQEAADEYTKAGRDDLKDKELAEADILRAYLPEQMDPDKVEDIIKEAISTTGATGQKDIGKVMAEVMPRVKGRADGKLVNQTVLKLLES